MRVTIEGHSYLLDASNGTTQPLDFIRKENCDGALVLVANGTTTEEVLRVLIDRMKYLQNSVPSIENVIVITKLEEALRWLEMRTADRIARNVEATPSI